MKRDLGLLRSPAMQICVKKKVQERNKKLAQFVCARQGKVAEGICSGDDTAN